MTPEERSSLVKAMSVLTPATEKWYDRQDGIYWRPYAEAGEVKVSEEAVLAAVKIHRQLVKLAGERGKLTGELKSMFAEMLVHAAEEALKGVQGLEECINPGSWIMDDDTNPMPPLREYDITARVTSVKEAKIE